MRNKKWTKEEDEYLKKNYNLIALKEICNELNRTKKSIYGRVGILECNKFSKTIWDDKSFKEFVRVSTNNEYEVLEEYKGYKIKIMLLHKTCGRKYPVSPEKFIQNRRCPFCAKDRINLDKKLTQEEFEKRVLEIDNGDFVVIGKYIGISTPIEIYHKKCGETFFVKPSNFLNRKRCLVCYEQTYRTKTHEEFCNEIYELYGDEYTILEEYIDAKTHLLVRHNCGKCNNHEWSITPDNLLRGYGCPSCSSSKGEKRIEKYLIKNNIEYIIQGIFQDLKGDKGWCLKFDFYLDKERVAIEFQGKQHYEPIKLFGGDSQFQIQKRYDELKRLYCKKNNIRLIEISYKDFNDLEKILELELNKNLKHIDL